MSRLGRAWSTLGRSTSAIAVVAAAMLLVTLAPSSLWQAPTTDLTLRGFDPVTMYAGQDEGGLAEGSVQMSSETLGLLASQGSSPLAHLATSPESFESTFSFEVRRADPATTPLRIAITSPYRQNEFRLVFGPSPGREIDLERVVENKVVSTQSLGVYGLGELSDVRASIDRTSDVAQLEVTTRNAGGQFEAAHLSDDGSRYHARMIPRSPLPVRAGASYTFSADVLTEVPGVLGMSLEWLDAQGERISIDPVWSRVKAAGTWTGYEVSGQAPEGAVAVRPEIGVGEGGSISAGRLAVRKATSVENLLPDGGPLSSWRRSDASGVPIELREYPATAIRLTATAQTFPELFEGLRMALTVSASAGDGVARTELHDFVLEVPHQTWMATRVSDPRLTAAVIGLAGLGTLALVAAASSWWLRRGRDSFRSRLLRAVTIQPAGRHVLAAASVAVFLVASLWLAHMGSSNADVIGARIWTYASARDGLPEIYFAPNFSPAEAGQWQGRAIQEAGFPYGPTMAYIYGAIGALYAFGVHQPALDLSDAGALDLMARLTNAAFSLLCAWLIARIIRKLGYTRRTSTIVACAFLLMPALAFSNSVWGSSQPLSLAFLLAAILFTLRSQLTAAWLMVLLCLATRPQVLIAAAVLAVVLVRTSRVRETLRAASTAMVVFFLMLLPFSLTISPSLPVDVVRNALFMHAENGNDTWTLPISWGVFTPWQLVVSLTQGIFGLESGAYLATNDVLPGLSYFHAGTIAFAMVFVAVVAIAAVRGRKVLEGGQFILLITLAVLALLLIKTGAATYHMVLPATLALLLIRCLPPPAYLFVAISLSLTTFVTMFGMAAYWFSAQPRFAVGLFAPDLAATAAFAWAVNNPVVVLVGAALNTASLVILAIYAVRRPRRAWPTEDPSARSSSDSLIDDPGDQTHEAADEPAPQSTLSRG